MSTSKIIISKEIIEAMVFLNIPTSKFMELKAAKGGLNQLHSYMAELLGA